MIQEMTAEEIKDYIKLHFPRENEAHEHKSFSNLKHSVAGSSGEDVISYVSGIANMEGGTLIIGIKDGSLEVEGIQNFGDYTLENFPNRILGNCPNLSAIGLFVEELFASDTSQRVWILHIPKHSPRSPVMAKQKAWQRVGDSLVLLKEERRREILNEPLGHDWSSEIISEAGLEALDQNAISKARVQYKQGNPEYAADCDLWSDTTFLDRAKITIGGKLTRASLLLLGKSESTHYLSPAPCQITWKLETEGEKAYEHFGPPFLLSTTLVLNRIRNVKIKLFPEDQLLPIEFLKYETRVILEALHNCIAHQNYELNERVLVTEKSDRLIFDSAGGFFDGAYEQYLSGDTTPKKYRNHWLANAMVNLGMIDTMGYGIREMFLSQRQRFLPLPDYSKSSSTHVILEVFGQVLDQRYSRLLQAVPDLSLDLVLGIDRVQKKQSISDELAKQLKRLEFIEGRKPNYIISVSVAAKTNQRADYTTKRGLDDSYYKKLVIDHLTRFGSTTKNELEAFLVPKLPDVMTADQKRNKVKNLLSSLRRDDKRVLADRPGKGAVWSLIEGSESDTPSEDSDGN